MGGEGKRCRKEEVSLMLSDYFTGHLDDSQRVLVEQHLAECPECRAALAAMELLATDTDLARAKAPPPHLSEETLTTFYQDPTKLSPEKQKRIAEHLATCPRCRQELQFLRHTEQELRDSLLPPEENRSAMATLTASFTREPWWPLASIAALLCVVIGISLIHTWYVGLPPGTAPGASVTCLLRETQRSAGEPTMVTRSAANLPLTLIVPLYPRDDREYTFVLSSPERNAETIRTLPLDSVSSGYAYLSLSTHTLEDQTYLINLFEVNAPAADTTVRYYPFVLRSPPPTDD